MKKITLNIICLVGALLLTYAGQAQNTNHKRIRFVGDQGNLINSLSGGGDGYHLYGGMQQGRGMLSLITSSGGNGTISGKGWTFHQQLTLKSGLWIQNGWTIGKSGSTSDLSLGRNMILTKTGVVGIGTTTPTVFNPNARLTVRGGDLQLEGGALTNWGSIVFQPDTDNSGDDAIIFKQGSSQEVMRIQANGFVGIGSANPQATLDLGSSLDKKLSVYQNAAGDSFFGLGAQEDTLQLWAGNTEVMQTSTNRTKFMKPLKGTNANFSGQVYLEVSSFPDYVFATGYDLMPLEKLETYIKKHQHLPRIPQATQVIKEGLDVGKINVLLMEKVEELTLHTITQNKQVQALLQRLEKLEKGQNK